MKKILTIIVCLIIVSIIGIYFYDNVEQNENKYYKGELNYSLFLTKHRYTQNDSILLKISLKNNNSHSIKVQPLILWLTYKIIITNESNIDIMPFEPKPYITAITDDDLIRLNPGEIIDQEILINDFFNLSKSDNKYFIESIYKPIISDDANLKSWKGELISNKIEFFVE